MGARLSGLLKAHEVPEGEEWLIPWASIRYYDDLVHVNGAYIAGHISASPYRYAPWKQYRHDPNAIAKLITLQRYGLVTVDYQPAYTVENQPSSANNGDRFYSMRRRPYVSFFVPKKTRWLNAVEAMFDDPDQYRLSISDSDTRELRTNFSGFIILNENKSANTIGDLSRKPYQEGALIQADMPFQTIDAFSAFPNILAALGNTICVTLVSALPFGQGDILDDLHTQLAINKNLQMYDVKM